MSENVIQLFITYEYLLFKNWLKEHDFFTSFKKKLSSFNNIYAFHDMTYSHNG